MQSKTSSENWRDVPTYEGRYEVSDLGRVRSVAHMTKQGRRGGCVRKLRADKDGYLLVDLWRGDEGKTLKVHRIVLSAFVGPCPEGHEACHFPDRSRSNNALSNLRWGTDSENSLDAVRHGTHGRLKFGVDVVQRIFALREAGHTHRQIAESLKCSKPYVEKVLYRKLRFVA